MGQKDVLFTLRWFTKELRDAADMSRVKSLTSEMEKLLTKEIGDEEEIQTGERETPAMDETLKATLVVIVGHEKKAPGATFALGGSEYEYNTKVSKLMEAYGKEAFPNMIVKTVFRDGIGISGAYKAAKGFKPDACIELHFNAFNTKAFGTETLCTAEASDKHFAHMVHGNICQVFSREDNSRGVKVLPKGARGGGNVHSLPGFANCLVEPFFGDNKEEAEVAVAKQSLYAKALVDASAAFFKEIGLA
jgi:N-acetylmuramoyl-L-alanine amidase